MRPMSSGLSVLFRIFLSVWANVGSSAVWGVKGQCVQFVIAHTADRAACVDQPSASSSGNPQRTEVCRLLKWRGGTGGQPFTYDF
jgi:hypothetical protein